MGAASHGVHGCRHRKRRCVADDGGRRAAGSLRHPLALDLAVTHAMIDEQYTHTNRKRTDWIRSDRSTRKDWIRSDR
eukprot:2548232-Rhodomonas_salina.2